MDKWNKQINGALKGRCLKIFIFKYSEFKGLELCKSVDIEIVCPWLVQKNV